VTEANYSFYDFQPTASDIKAEVLASLSEAPKRVSPKFFYDARGSKLFDAICDLPEYYPTRTEIALLQEHGAEMADLIGRTDTALFELGSGSSIKIRTLLSALRPNLYVPMDISREHLAAAARAVAADYPQMRVAAVCVDYSQDWALPAELKYRRRAAYFPGSSIGNLEPEAAAGLLGQVRRLVGEEGGFLVAADLKKDRATLEAAYNDAQGVTAAFNLNLLRRLNRDIGADFDLDAFRHVAFYNEALGRIEMHLESLKEQEARVAGRAFRFSEGERIHTENSHKYDIDEFQAMAAGAGFRPVRHWVDPQGLFSIHFLEAERR